MPSYNQARFIGESIDSVFKQSVSFDVELIIFDGGSQDGTVDVLKAKAAKYPNLRWVSEADTGPANALNKALAKTRGTIIGWLNSDDLYKDKTFARVHDYFENNPQKIMVYGQGEHTDVTGKPTGRYPTQKPEAGFAALRNGCYICQPTVFFKRTLYTLQGPLDESYKAAFDYEYWLRAFKSFEGRIGFIDYVLAQSRLHDDCITQKMRGLVAHDGARASHQYFGQAPIHWLSTYVEEMQKELGPEGFASQSGDVLAFAKSLNGYFAPDEVNVLIDNLNEIHSQSTSSLTRPSVKRFTSNPLIDFSTSESLGNNINGPSIIRVPEWVENPLGKYYMYFSHHSGTYIRLAYADNVEGPWTVYEAGTLKLSETESFHNHIASPDVHVDDINNRIIMYFHGPAKDVKGQKTGVALSKDGLAYTASPEILGKFYFRVWKWKGYYYALAKNDNKGFGELYRSKDGITNFESRGNFLKAVRHSAVHVLGSELYIFYSRVGDAPERIVMAVVDLSLPWEQWEPSEPIEIMQTEESYEGASYPVMPSKYGSAINVHQLRDPAILNDDEHIYLFYSFAGEEGIAGATLHLNDD